MTYRIAATEINLTERGVGRNCIKYCMQLPSYERCGTFYNCR